MLKEKNKQYFIIYILLLIASAFLIMATEGSWWARYTPYLYLIPIYNLIYFSTLKKGKKIQILLTILLAVNITLILYPSVKHKISDYQYTKKVVKTFIRDVQEGEKIQVELKTNEHEGLKFNIYDLVGDKKITYLREIKDEKDGFFFTYSVIK